METIQSESLKGHFLMAMPGLLDPNFFQTVTCISEHTADGALGLVINRVHQSLTADVIFNELKITAPIHAEKTPVFIGGPVHIGEVFVLHGSPFHWEGCLQVTASLGMSNTIDILETIAMGVGPAAYLLMLGCAGWGEGQLEAEIKQNAWLTSPAIDEIIFQTPADQRWEAALQGLGVDPGLLSGTAGHA
ncbi:UPF0301 protein YqgE [Olavius algarvensis associated proteobacterium Delta 3]|nr:UPF0301 protein YqgE [Olavius algarvensis associated proteobacterium Delta 3]